MLKRYRIVFVKAFIKDTIFEAETTHFCDEEYETFKQMFSKHNTILEEEVIEVI